MIEEELGAMIGFAWYFGTGTEYKNLTGVHER
jgi:hypothetical protein